MSDFVPERFHTVLAAPAWMDVAEKTVLYALVVGREPDRVLEVGTLEGGATAVLCAALDDLGHGRLVTVDAQPRVPAATWELLEHRARQAADVATGLAALGGDADLVLLGHPQSEADVADTIAELLGALADGAHVLVHDAHQDAVAAGVRRVLAEHPARLRDGGLVASARTVEHLPDGETTDWGGLRLLHHVAP